MIKIIKSALVGSFAALLMGVSMSASAALAGSWTASVDGTATDIANGVRLDMSTPNRFTYTSSATAAGTFTFSWQAGVFGGPEADVTFGTFNGATDSTLFLYTLFLNGDPTQGIGPTEASGTGSISVSNSDSFGFFMEALADSAGNAFLEITDLNFREAQTSDVPEPGSIALLGLGLIGLAAMRRRKTA